MSDEAFRHIVYADKEARNREYKASFPWTKVMPQSLFRAKLTRTILGMSNLRDGGHIVIGVNEVTERGVKRCQPVGAEVAHVNTFDPDEMADFVQKYADPYARFGVDIVELDGRQFVVVSVAGFDKYPVICRASYETELSQGAIYVRPESGRPRTEIVSSYKEMRDLVDLATELGVRRYLETQARVGQGGPSDAEQFARQRGDLA